MTAELSVTTIGYLGKESYAGKHSKKNHFSITKEVTGKE